MRASLHAKRRHISKNLMSNKNQEKYWCFKIAIFFWNPISSKKLMGKNKNVRKPHARTQACSPADKKKKQNHKQIQKPYIFLP